MKLKLAATLLLVCAGMANAGGSASSPVLPKTLRYSFYVQGEPAGHTDIKVTQTRNSLIFESQTLVATVSGVVSLASKTVADPKTYVVRDYTYKGTKGSTAVAGQAQIVGDSVYGFVERDGKIADKHFRSRHSHTVIFEDWVMEHEILLALTQAASPNKTGVYGLVFTSSLTPAEVTVGYTGEVLVEAGNRSFTARKLIVLFEGAEPFESHVDPVRGVPVYIRFPASRTEVFLDEVFGENPVTSYSIKKSEQ